MSHVQELQTNLLVVLGKKVVFLLSYSPHPTPPLPDLTAILNVTYAKHLKKIHVVCGCNYMYLLKQSELEVMEKVREGICALH